VGGLCSEGAARGIAVTVRPATAGDLDSILGWESEADAAPFVTNWPLERHEQALASTTEEQLVVCEDGRPAGFILLRATGVADRAVELARIVVARKGVGVGGAALELTLRRCFRELGARRVWLDVMPGNARARHAYARAGLLEDGLAPAGPDDDDDHALIVMSISAQRWREAMAPGAPPT
jgi:diamine N-acetyltransferase